jgi:hypothetical protein
LFSSIGGAGVVKPETGVGPVHQERTRDAISPYVAAKRPAPDMRGMLT